LILLFIHSAICLAAYAEDQLPTSAEDTNPLRAGVAAPLDATFSDVASQSVNLRGLLKSGPKLLIFYRGGWCPYCNSHLGALATVAPRLEELGVQIAAISPDKPEKLKEAEEQSYTLYSDSKLELAKAFGLAFKVDSETVHLYKNEYNIDLEEYSGETHHLLPVPAAYLINQQGEIVFAHSNTDYKVRVELEDLLLAAQNLKD